MSSSRYSRWAILAAVALLAFAAVGTAVAVQVSEEDVPDEGQVGEDYTASVTLGELYQNPDYTSWTLRGETELQNVTWTVTTTDTDTGNQIDSQSFDGQSFNYSNIDAEANDANQVTVEVTGTVPSIENFTYADEEMFVVASLTQAREGGTSNEIASREAHHFTEESQAAREAIVEAQAAIDEADSAGGDTSTAEDSLESAISAYEGENFGNAQNLASRAQEEANTAKSNAESTEQRNQLLLYAGVGVVVVALIGGGFYWYRQQQDDHSRLG
ncbi:hypothetical protein [Haloarchaeobius iranensis]|uniref:Uncharacterized protein n=1 Tax=Haloarchaeobius iranensis TaxID=996166 RepID=A0A1G9YBR1_9EURY|nr:hypothetical protein [Haloarchaeobius iranensis]SDN06106.1 hypothetical protein SAMN05192554_11395 [Haloarchaeobius iranensis]